MSNYGQFLIFAKNVRKQDSFIIYAELMKISEKYKVREMAGQHVVIIQGRNGADMTKIISLNDTSLFLWNQMKDREFDVEDAADALVSRYGIDRELAARDAQAWCDKLEECHLLAE